MAAAGGEGEDSTGLCVTGDWGAPAAIIRKGGRRPPGGGGFRSLGERRPRLAAISHRSGRRCRRRRSGSSRLLPAAEDVVDREEVHLGILVGILGAHFREEGPEKVLRAAMPGPRASRDIPDTPWRPRPSSSAGRPWSTQAIVGSAWILIEGTTISKSPGRKLLGQQQLVLPVDQYVADAAFHEGGRGATGAGVEHGHVPEEGGDKRLGLLSSPLLAFRA
jgi:hypothetical protein